VPPLLRPLRDEDVAAVHQTAVRAFEALDRQSGRPAQPPPAPERAHLRIRHLLGTDPEGAWVAERNGEIVGAALALRREGLWGLSLLVVHPDAQSAGTGRALLERAHASAAGAHGEVILASEDPRALRAYARLGLTLHPCVVAAGVPQGVAAPAAVRAGTEADLPLAAATDRRVRGAPHGPDLGAMLAAGGQLLVLPERGYVVLRPEGSVWTLAAGDDEAARGLLRAVLARAGEAATEVEWLTAAQHWAVQVCVDAGLELQGAGGAVFLRGDVGPFSPYLPSGAYL
jgi:predicted N-acetyltransferase YhbS